MTNLIVGKTAFTKQFCGGRNTGKLFMIPMKHRREPTTKLYTDIFTYDDTFEGRNHADQSNEDGALEAHITVLSNH